MIKYPILCAIFGFGSGLVIHYMNYRMYLASLAFSNHGITAMFDTLSLGVCFTIYVKMAIKIAKSVRKKRLSSLSYLAMIAFPLSFYLDVFTGVFPGYLEGLRDGVKAKISAERLNHFAERMKGQIKPGDLKGMGFENSWEILREEYRDIYTMSDFKPYILGDKDYVHISWGNALNPNKSIIIGSIPEHVKKPRPYSGRRSDYLEVYDKIWVCVIPD
jgi:hypothetical protein